MRRILFVLCLLLIPSVGLSQTAWPKKGDVFVKGCEELTKVLDPLFTEAGEEAKKTGEMYHVTAKICLNGVLHVRTTLKIKMDGLMVETDVYSTFKFTGQKTKSGKPIVEAQVEGIKVIDKAQFPSESAEKDLPEGSERF